MSDERWFLSYCSDSGDYVVRKGAPIDGEIIGSYEEVKKAWFEAKLHNANKEVK